MDILGDTNLYTLQCDAVVSWAEIKGTNQSRVTVSFWLANDGDYIDLIAAWTLRWRVHDTSTYTDIPVNKDASGNPLHAKARTGVGWEFQWERSFTVTHDESGNRSIDIDITGGSASTYTATYINDTNSDGTQKKNNIKLDPITPKLIELNFFPESLAVGQTTEVQIKRPDGVQVNQMAMVTIGLGSHYANLDPYTNYSSTLETKTWTFPSSWADVISGDIRIGTIVVTTYIEGSQTAIGSKNYNWTAKKSSEPEPEPEQLPEYTYNNVSELFTGAVAYILPLGTSHGDEIAITQEDIMSYDVSANLSSGEIPLGGTVSRDFSLTFDNTNYNINYRTIESAAVSVRAYSSKTYPPAESDWHDFGVWYVKDITASDQSYQVTITGTDAMDILLDKPFVAPSSYSTVGFLLQHILTSCGMSNDIETPEFINYDLAISETPDWSDDITFRDVVGYIAMCAAGYARISNTGKLQIVTPGHTAPKHTVDPEYYTELTNRGGQGFTFNALEVTQDDTSTRHVIDSTIAPDPTNTIQVEWNPLLTDDVINTIMSKYNGLWIEGATLSWFGHPDVLPGDMLTVTRTNPSERASTTVTMLITDYTLSFDSGGISCECNSNVPTVNSDGTSGYSSSVQVFNPDGTVNAKAISGIPLEYRTGKVENVSSTATSVTFDNAMQGTPFVFVTQCGGSYAPAIVTNTTRNGFSIRSNVSGTKYKYMAIYFYGVASDD